MVLWKGGGRNNSQPQHYACDYIKEQRIDFKQTRICAHMHTQENFFSSGFGTKQLWELREQRGNTKEF